MSDIILLHLVLVLPFIQILKREIQPSGNHTVTQLVFSIDDQSQGAYYPAKIISKYSPKILRQRIIPLEYRHIIIAMIKAAIDHDIDEISGDFAPIFIPDFDTELGESQENYCKSK